jgi:hypothetical protein
MLGEIEISYGIYCVVPSGSHTHGEKHHDYSALVSQPGHCSDRPKLEAFAKSTAHAPLLGLLSAFVTDWVPLIDEYYYCA